MQQGLLISASDTNVGKTVVTSGLIAALRAAGRDAVPYKPVESGCEDRERPADGLALWTACGHAASLDDICPIRLKRPLAPNLAARVEGVTLSHEAIRDGFHRLAAEHEIVLVETAGGACSPFTETWLAADLARELDLPVLLVVPDRLGAIHQALAAKLGAEACGAKVIAVVLNQVEPEPDGAQAGNRSELRRLLPELTLRRVPHLPPDLEPEELGEIFGDALDLTRLLGE